MSFWYNLVIYTIQTFTILSRQNKGNIGTFQLHNIYKRIIVTAVSDFEINAALE